MSVQSFRPHGRFAIRVEGQIVLSDVTGPWNRELVQAWAAELDPLVSHLGPHVGIATIHHSMASTPEAMALLGKIVRFSASQRQCLAHILVVGPDVEGRLLLAPNFLALYEGVVEYGLHASLDQAVAQAQEILARHGVV